MYVTMELSSHVTKLEALRDSLRSNLAGEIPGFHVVRCGELLACEYQNRQTVILNQKIVHEQTSSYLAIHELNNWEDSSIAQNM
jgi:hypothetical protein